MEEKIKLEEFILQDSRSTSHFNNDNRYRWGEVLAILEDNKIELQDTDILEVGFVDGWNEGDSSRDSAYDLTIIRTREETDEEFERRMERKKKSADFAKEQRYLHFLKLKDEFENTI